MGKVSIGEFVGRKCHYMSEVVITSVWPGVQEVAAPRIQPVAFPSRMMSTADPDCFSLMFRFDDLT